MLIKSVPVWVSLFSLPFDFEYYLYVCFQCNVCVTVGPWARQLLVSRDSAFSRILLAISCEIQALAGTGMGEHAQHTSFSWTVMDEHAQQTSLAWTGMGEHDRQTSLAWIGMGEHAQ